MVIVTDKMKQEIGALIRRTEEDGVMRGDLAKLLNPPPEFRALADRHWIEVPPFRIMYQFEDMLGTKTRHLSISKNGRPPSQEEIIALMREFGFTKPLGEYTTRAFSAIHIVEPLTN